MKKPKKKIRKTKNNSQGGTKLWDGRIIDRRFTKTARWAERLLVFELTDNEYEEYEKLSPCEIMSILKEYGFRNDSDYLVQPGAQYTDYDFIACVPHGFGGQLIIKEITSYNV